MGGQLLGVRGSLALTLYGLVVAAAAMALMGASAQWPVTFLRAQFLDRTVAAQREGLPPLVAVASPAPDSAQRVYMQPGAGDDAGPFLFAPALTRLLGLRSGTDGLRALYMLMFGATIAAYPLLFNALFKSRAAAIAAPLALVAALPLVVGNADIYWVGAWAVLALGPVLLVVIMRRPRRAGLWLVGVALGASLATSLRSGAGLGIAAGCLAAALVIERSWRRRIPLALVVVAAYLAVTPGIVALAQSYRDAHLKVRIDRYPSSHLFWHPLYLGVGFDENPFEITWDDDVAIARAHQIDPTANYPSAAYDAVVRQMFFKLLRRDSGAVWTVESQKIVVAIGRAALLTLLALAMLCLLGSADPRWPKALLVLLPSAALGLASGVMGVPDAEYLEGWLGVLALVVVLGIAGAIAGRAAVVRRLVAPASRRTVIATGVASLMVIGAAVGTPSLESACRNWQGHWPRTACGGYEHPLPFGAS